MDIIRESLLQQIRDVAIFAAALRLFQETLDSSTDLQQLFRQRYMEYKSKVELKQLHPGELYWLRFTYSAIGLFSYGCLEVVDDIIDNIPPFPTEQGDGLIKKWVSGSLAILLPLPEKLDEHYIREHPAELREWVNAHRHRLVWNDETNGYILKDES